jgi:manganese/zinc/iron transport system substrate-binding protein
MAVLLAGCRQGGLARPDLAGRPVRVVATTGMVADLVRNVGGERVQVTSLMGPGVDPHLYRASERDVIRLAEADLVFYNGLHLEGRMGKVFERMGRQKRVRAVAVTDGIDRSLLLEEEESQGHPDPHVWFDVELWMKGATLVRDTLTELDPQHAGLYWDNAARYLIELEDLHRYVKTRAEEVPEKQRVLITAHDAFNYFGRAYGFEVMGLQGISTAAEAGTADVQRIAKYIADNRIPAVFIESSVPERNIQALQEAVRAHGFEVAVGGELFSDALGAEGTEEGTYVGMVRHNIDTIVYALTRKND